MSLSTEEMWTIYHKRRSIKRRNDLVVHYLPLASRYANRMRRKTGDYLSQEELFGAASFGLIDAVEAFNPKRKIKFESFSPRRINGAIIDWLRETDKQSRTVRDFEKKKQKILDALAQNESYTDEDVAQHMGLSDERFRLLNGLSFHKEIHLSALAGDKDYEPYEVPDVRTPGPAHAIERQFLQEFIERALNRIDCMIIMLYYFESLTLHEIGNIMNLSDSRVCQIRQDAVACLRWNFQRDNL